MQRLDASFRVCNTKECKPREAGEHDRYVVETLFVPRNPARSAAKITAPEVRICQRLRLTREANKLSQPMFASELGISLDTLKNYEYSRTAIRYSVAKALGTGFDINQRWLATGKLPMHPYVDVAREMEAAIPAHELFSVVYDRVLAVPVTDSLQVIADTAGCDIEKIDQLGAIPHLEPIGGPYDRTTLNIWRRLAHQLVSSCLHVTPPELRGEFVAELRAVVHRFEKAHRAKIRSYYDRRRLDADTESEKAAIAEMVRRQLSGITEKH